MLHNFRLFGLAALLLALAASCSSNSATSFHPAVSGPAALKLCPLPNVPPKRIAAAPGFREYIVTVAGPQGQPIDGLNESDFSLSIEGRSVPISYFRTSDGKLPTAIAIVVDSSGSMRDKLALDSGAKFDIVREKLALAAQKFGACDELALLTFGGSANGFAPHSLSQAIFSPPPPFQLAEPFTTDYEGAIDRLDLLTPWGQTPLYDSMLRAIGDLSISYYGNRTLLIITDGADNVSEATEDQVLREAQLNNVSIFAVGIGDPSAKFSPVHSAMLKLLAGSNAKKIKPEEWVDVIGLTRMASETGGRFWLIRPLQPDSEQKLTEALQEFTDSIGHGYSIGVVDAGNRPIRVSVKGYPDAIVHARPAGV
jgi:VWFA-related protein